MLILGVFYPAVADGGYRRIGSDQIIVGTVQLKVKIAVKGDHRLFGGFNSENRVAARMQP